MYQKTMHSHKSELNQGVWLTELTVDAFEMTWPTYQKSRELTSSNWTFHGVFFVLHLLLLEGEFGEEEGLIKNPLKPLIPTPPLLLDHDLNDNLAEMQPQFQTN